MANSEPEGASGMDTTENPINYSVTSDAFRINLERHRVFVEGRMDPNHGLVERLRETDAIDNNQIQIIRAERVPFKKNREILDIILEGKASEKIKKFCEALTYTKQQHLVNYVEANGEYMTQFVGVWPLNEKEINIIDKNLSYLTQRIDTACGLLADMRKHDTITQWQEECVSEHTSRLDRNTALLEIIRRGSLSEYKNTIDRLVETNQGHIAKILWEGGVVLQIHSRATGNVLIIKQAEAELVTQLLNTMPEKTMAERAHLLELAQLKNLGSFDAVVIESIGLFFHCKNMSDFLRLLRLLENKELQKIVEVIYNEFISTSTKIEVTLTWSDDEFSRVERSLQEMESTYEKSQVAPVAETTEFELNIPPPVQAGSSQPTEVKAHLAQPDEMYGITADIIRKHKELLKDRLQDAEFGILETLLANDGLTHQEMTAIENCSTYTNDRSKKLIDVVLEKNIVSAFIKALVDTDQKHLVNYLKGDGVYNEEFGDDWPLGDDRIKQLNVNQAHLINIIEPCDSGLISLLLSARVINKRQYNCISEETTTISKNEALLSIIRRQSIKDYSSTIGCLIKSNQQHVAEILQKPGVIQRIRVSQEGDPQTVNQIEDALTDLFSNLLFNRPIEKAKRILKMTLQKIIAAKKDV